MESIAGPSDAPPGKPGTRRWLGVLLSFFVPGFGLLRAGHWARGVGWFCGLYFASTILALLYISVFIPTGLCFLATFVALSAEVVMLIDSFRPGKMSTASWSLFVLLAVAIAVLPTPAHWVTRPYHIPTGSMQPTLNGIIAYPRDQEPPALMKRLIDLVVSGRNYINVVSKEDDEVIQIVPHPFGFFSPYSKIVGRRQTFLIRAPAFTLKSPFRVAPYQTYRAGDVIARGAIDSGDQIFADTLTYRFHGPRRGDVVVFSSDGIAQIQPDPLTGPVTNIKRIAGLPGDVLRIDPPSLYVNGRAAQAEGFKRVMSGANGYRGYFNGRDYLANATDEYKVPEHTYFVLGDNSYNSYDSRYFGCVPERNIIGRVARIYYPFSREGVPN